MQDASDDSARREHTLVFPDKDADVGMHVGVSVGGTPKVSRLSRMYGLAKGSTHSCFCLSIKIGSTKPHRETFFG